MSMLKEKAVLKEKAAHDAKLQAIREGIMASNNEGQIKGILAMLETYGPKLNITEADMVYS